MTTSPGPRPSALEAVFFISFGGPERSEEVMPFLERVTQGRGIPKARLAEVAHHYEAIGGASPINAITRRQAQALKNYLAQSGTPLPVYIGQRNWHPFIEDTLRDMIRDGIHRAIGFVTAAQRCEASAERYLNAVEEARRAIGPEAPVIEYVDPWFDHPLFVKAIGARIQEMSSSRSAALRPETSWIFTAHSIPIPMAETSRYIEELEAAAGQVAYNFGKKQWTLAYTSRSGKPTDRWLEPDICDEIREQAQRGVREILAIPIGFVADHVEVLFDLDVEAREAAREAGVAFHRAGTVGDHPLFIQMIADLVLKTMTTNNGGMTIATG